MYYCMDMGDSTSDISDGENSAVFHLYSLGSRGQLRGRVSRGTIFSILKGVGGTEILLCARTPSLTNIIKVGIGLETEICMQS